MKVIIYDNERQEKIDPKTLKVNNITLDQWFAKLNELEKRLVQIENKLNKESEFAKSFKERRL